MDVSGLASGVAAIAAGGGSHLCADERAAASSAGETTATANWATARRTDRCTPVDVSGLTSGVSAIAAGGVSHLCADEPAAGSSAGATTATANWATARRRTALTPVDVSGLASGVSAIAAGGCHTCALTDAAGGGVKCWGDNGYGQLGDGTTTDRTTPVDVSGLASGVAAIAAGGVHTCALTQPAAGSSAGGTTATANWATARRPTALTPVDVSGLASGVGAIAAGG